MPLVAWLTAQITAVAIVIEYWIQLNPAVRGTLLAFTEARQIWISIFLVIVCCKRRLPTTLFDNG